MLFPHIKSEETALKAELKYHRRTTMQIHVKRRHLSVMDSPTNARLAIVHSAIQFTRMYDPTTNHAIGIWYS